MFRNLWMQMARHNTTTCLPLWHQQFFQTKFSSMILIWKIAHANKTNQGHKIRSLAFNRVAKWAIFFLINRVRRFWRLWRHTSTQTSLECPPRRGVSLIKVTNAKIKMSTFMDQILCPLNGGVPKERFHFIVLETRQWNLWLCNDTSCVMFLAQRPPAMGGGFACWFTYFTCWEGYLTRRASVHVRLRAIQSNKKSLIALFSWSIWNRVCLPRPTFRIE